MPKTTRNRAFTPSEKIDMERFGTGAIKRAEVVEEGVSLVAITFPSGPVAGYIGRVIRTKDQDEEE